MKKNEENYKYLLRLYSQVSDYLADITNKQENLPEVIIAFCVVSEKIFKIRLHNENPVLVYDNCKFKEDDALVTIVKNKELNIETIKIREAINRYKLVFSNEFSDDEMQALIDIYNVRNHFIHGYKSDDYVLSDEENIIKKMGTVWEKISIQAISIFGKNLIKDNKPKKKYSEEELEKVLTEEVKKKIESITQDYDPIEYIHTRNFRVQPPNIQIQDQFSMYNSALNGFIGERCPRCGSYDFSLNMPDLNWPSFPSMYNYNQIFSDLYKCKKCNLELTAKEYEIAKKLKN